MIVTFSGMDGAGKSTQIENLGIWAKSKGSKVVYLWSRGGYTPGLEFLKKVIRKCAMNVLPPPGNSEKRDKKLYRPRIACIWLTLAILDLIMLYGFYVRLINCLGKLIICDRYLNDTMIDFRNNFPKISFDEWRLWKLLIKMTPKSDIAFLMTVPVDVSLKRSRIKSEPFPDNEETLQQRLNAYFDKQVFPANRYFHLDGRGDLKEIHRKICDAVMKAADRCSDGAFYRNRLKGK